VLEVAPALLHGDGAADVELRVDAPLLAVGGSGPARCGFFAAAAAAATSEGAPLGEAAVIAIGEAGAVQVLRVTCAPPRWNASALARALDGAPGSRCVALRVALALNGVDFELAAGGGAAELCEAPAPVALAPAVGSTEGGVRVRLSGRGLRGTAAAACRFGADAVVAARAAGGDLECIAPPRAGAPGAVSIALTLNGHDW
jgi:hypothetical protein